MKNNLLPLRALPLLTALASLALTGCSRDKEEKQAALPLPMMGTTVPDAAPVSPVELDDAPSSGEEATTAAESVDADFDSPAPEAAPDEETVHALGMNFKASRPLVIGNLLAEINRVRKDPRAYAEFLMALRRRGATYPNGRPVIKAESPATVDEAIRVLRATPPLPPLKPNARLNAAAAYHVADLGPKGRTGHTSSNGQTFVKRLRRYVPNARILSENIFSGRYTERELVIAWLIEDGVYNRGHRKNILSPRTQVAGVACGPHARYTKMCVVDFAKL